MADFQVPVDIANRALQHVGYSPFLQTLTDNSKAASQTNFIYDKVRRAELRRNVWTFATRRAVVRPYDPTCQLITPGTYNPAYTYLPGSVVMYNGLVYEANEAIPVATPPDVNSSAAISSIRLSAPWGLYFGPIMATAWTYNANPSGPFLWVSTTSYAAGSIVVGSDGNEYNSVINGNVGYNPVNDGGVHWQLIGAAATGQGYYSGEIVYYPSGPNPGYYRCMLNGTSSVPNAYPLWTASTVYAAYQTVSYNSVIYQSTLSLNSANTPVAAWAIGTTYAANAQVLGTDGNLYSSIAGGNVGNNPTTTTGFWTKVSAAYWIAVPATQPHSYIGQYWIYLGDMTGFDAQINYPLGTGPSTQSSTKNIYILPNGFLRPAPQAPKDGVASYLGAPSEARARDWIYENGFMISSDIDPIPLRFVADVCDVAQFDAMFCEGFACRIAMDICEPLTQSSEKLRDIEGKYKTYMGDARLVDGIERGSTQAPMDLYISCRI